MTKISVVGIGPGDYRDMTLRAVDALNAADVIVGYTVYVDLIREHFPGKEFLSTPMRREEERCRTAVELARQGRGVALVCSGDAGVYGMAGLLLEVCEGEGAPEIEIIGGLTAATSGAALLGAPLGHDFAVISLSDLLTPWETIERRLDCAARGNFAVALYNPASAKRRDHLRRACEIMLRHASPDTVCGVAKNVGRPGESTAIMTLAGLKDYEADMFTTVFIGNSHTRVIDGRMVTPRGYRNE